MPVFTERAMIGGALAFEAGEQRGIERVTLRAVATLAPADVVALIAGRTFHRRNPS